MNEWEIIVVLVLFTQHKTLLIQTSNQIELHKKEIQVININYGQTILGYCCGKLEFTVQLEILKGDL